MQTASLETPARPERSTSARHAQQRSELVKDIVAVVLVTGLIAACAFAGRSPASPPRLEVNPAVPDGRVSAVAALPTSDRPMEIDVIELRHQQIAVHG